MTKPGVDSAPVGVSREGLSELPFDGLEQDLPDIQPGVKSRHTLNGLIRSMSTDARPACRLVIRIRPFRHGNAIELVDYRARKAEGIEMIVAGARIGDLFLRMLRSLTSNLLQHCTRQEELARPLARCTGGIQG
jgi:hypothetical protein